MFQAKHVQHPEDAERTLCGQGLSPTQSRYIHAAQAQNGYPCLHCVPPRKSKLFLVLSKSGQVALAHFRDGLWVDPEGNSLSFPVRSYQATSGAHRRQVEYIL